MLQTQGYLQNPSNYKTITIMLHDVSTLVTPRHMMHAECKYTRHCIGRLQNFVFPDT